jgi:hypothetical protein
MEVRPRRLEHHALAQLDRWAFFDSWVDVARLLDPEDEHHEDHGEDGDEQAREGDIERVEFHLSRPLYTSGTLSPRYRANVLSRL